MIRRKAEQRAEILENPHDGQGQITITHCMEKLDHANPRFQMLSRVTVPPGVRVGLHNHAGKTEAFCILEGVCLYDDGEQHTLLPGDCVVVSGAEAAHQLQNPGPNILVYLVSIVAD